MKNNDSSNTPNESLGVWNNPELEARLVAMLMGELSPFEEAEMEQELERSPELRLFRDRMIEVQGLITAVNRQVEDESNSGNEVDDDDWSLSPERKSALLENFAEEKVPDSPAGIISTTSIQWRNVFSIAACLLISLAAFMVMFVRKGVIYKNEENIVSYYSAVDVLEDESKSVRAKDMHFNSLNPFGSKELKVKGGTSFVLPVDENKSLPFADESLLANSVKWIDEKEGDGKKKRDYRSRELIYPTEYDFEEERIIKPEVSDIKWIPSMAAPGKPSSPSSSMAKVIAANTPSASAIPVPNEVVNDPSLDFGDGDDFGDGFGTGSANGVAGGEGRKAEGKLALLDSLKQNQRYAQDDPFGESEQQALAYGQEIPMIDPTDKTIDFQGKRYSLMDNNLEGLKPFESRSLGGFKKDLSRIINEADLRMPAEGFINDDKILSLTKIFNSNSTDSKAWKATLKDTDKYAWWVGDGSKKVKPMTAGNRSGDYAISRDSIDSFLNDPNRTAPSSERDLVQKEIARRGLDVAEADKSDYYRAAYDQTRSAMLAEVDKAWELAVPSAEGSKDDEYEDRVTLADSVKNMRNKLSNIQLPLVDFDEDATVKDAINFLRSRASELDSNELDPAKKGLSFSFRNPTIVDAAEGMGDAGIELEGINDIENIKLGSLKLRNVPMDEALRQIAQKTGLRYKVEGGEITLLRATDVDDNEMYARTFRVSPNFINILRNEEKGRVTGDPFEDESVSSKKANLAQLLERQGIKFPEGATAGYSKERGTLTIRNTAQSLDYVEELVDSFKPAPKATSDFSKEISAARQTHSTFSLNVSDVSYKLAKSVLLEKGVMPEPDKIRVEEFVNALDYGDPSASGKKVNCVVEQCAHPFYQQRNLMRIGMKTGAMGRSQPLRLTVLLDNSGSMEREDRAATVVKAVEALASQLGPLDEVTLLSFARGARLVAQKVKGDQAHKLVNLVRSIPSEGGTNLSLAIEQAYTTAQQSIQEGTMSRIVLITDGAANLGNADPEDLSKSIEKMRQNGIAFDACGVGADGLDDDMLEALTRKGDGRYYFINRPEDADAGFAQKLAGALRPAAKNVKVQVVFNPERVGNYRLIGFEKHRLKKQDFRNDTVDAAEMAAEEAGNALYQVEARPDGEGDVGTVFVRFRDMATGQMVERSWAIPYQPNINSLSSADPSMQLATVAGMLGERLKQGEEAGIDIKQLKPIYGMLRSHFHADNEVKDLIRMCEKVSGDQ
ncbi:MAG: hypothetical protein ACI9SQ_000040 [Rubritalea sp.]|jgi:hypothetical protein